MRLLIDLPSVTSHDCKHLVIDAGHVSIESDLVDKGATEFLHLKRNKKYEDQDYEYLESLMYDRFLLKLDAAQVCESAIVDDIASAHSTLVHRWRQSENMSGCP